MSFTMSSGVGSASLDRHALPAVGAMFLALAWLLPNHEAPWSSFHDETLAAFGGACFVLFAVLSAAGRSGRLPVAALALLLVALVPWAQWGVGLVPFHGDALLVCVYLVGVALCVWAGHEIGTNADAGRCLLRALAQAFLWAAILSTGIALYQWFGLSGLGIWAREGVSGARAGGNLGQPNHLATVVMFGLAATMWLRAERRLGAGVSALTSGFLVLGLSLTASRAPWIGLLLLGAWALSAPVSVWRKMRPQLRFATPLLLLYLLAYWAVQVLPGPLNLADTGVGQGRMQVGLRPLLWSQFALALKESPWLGYGWQGGMSGQALAALQRPGLEVTAYSHNILLDLLIWNGVPLGMLLVTILIVWYVRLGMKVREAGGWFQFAVLTQLLAHGLVEYPHAYTHFLVPAALLTGHLQARHATGTLKCPRRVMAAIAAVTVAASAAIVLDYLPFVADSRDVMFRLARIGGDYPLPPSPPGLVLDQLGASARWARLTPTPAMSAAQIEAQLALSRHNPSPFFLRQSVLILAMNGQTEFALTELHRARGLHGAAVYGAIVDEVRELAASSRPELGVVVDRIDATHSQLPRLPALTKAVSGATP